MNRQLSRQPGRSRERATNTLARISPMVRGRSSKMLWCARVCVRDLQGRMAWMRNQLEAASGSSPSRGAKRNQTSAGRPVACTTT